MDLLELIMLEPAVNKTVKRKSFTKTRDSVPEMKSFSNTRKRLAKAKRRASLQKFNKICTYKSCSNSHQNNRAIYGNMFLLNQVMSSFNIWYIEILQKFVHTIFLKKVRNMSKNGFTNVDGLITRTEDARISVLDRGFLYGDSLYEVYLTLVWVEILYQ